MNEEPLRDLNALGGSFCVYGMEEYDISTEYEQMALEIMQEREELQWLRNVKIGFLASTKEKKSKKRAVLGECIKVQDVYRAFMPYDFIIVMYERNMAGMSDYQKRIVMHHELLHIGMDESDGEPKYEVIPHDIEDFKAIIDEYGLNWQR